MFPVAVGFHAAAAIHTDFVELTETASFSQTLKMNWKFNTHHTGVCVLSGCCVVALLHFHTLTMPSLDEVTMKPCVVWKVAMSVMMSWCPTGRDSGPRRGESSTTPLFCLL